MNNTWRRFDIELRILFSTSRGKSYPQVIIDKIAFNYLDYKHNPHNSDEKAEKTKNKFSTKDKLGKMSKSMKVYRFCCARCKSCYNGEATKVVTVRAKEHLFTDKLSAANKLPPRMQSGIGYLIFFGH